MSAALLAAAKRKAAPPKAIKVIMVFFPLILFGLVPCADEAIGLLRELAFLTRGQTAAPFYWVNRPLTSR
jgi:hypothetical protein